MRFHALLLTLTLGLKASAECPASSLEVSRVPSRLPPRPWFVLGLQGSLAQEHLSDELVLRRDDVRIKVEVVSSELGANWRQVVVTPVEALTSGGWALEALPGTAVALVHRNTLRLAEFEVVEGAQHVPSLSDARFVGFQSGQFGCGGAFFAEVAVATDDSEAMFEVTLTSDSFTSTVLLPITSRQVEGPMRGEQSVVRIGFDVCGGPVRLPSGTTFAASLTPISRDGRSGLPYLVSFSTPKGVTKSSSLKDGLESLGPRQPRADASPKRR
jgi:hypothetical protein